jgi:hypothetical protein
MMVNETKKQLPDWRLYGRTAEQGFFFPRFSFFFFVALILLQVFRDSNAFFIFHWAAVCERLASTDCECLVLYFQMFFSLYFERSASGQHFAHELIRAVDPQLPSRLAGALERLRFRYFFWFFLFP